MKDILKKTTAFFIAIILMLSNISCVFAEDNANLGLTSKSYVLMEESTGNVLVEGNSHEKLPPASVTKVMTLLLIFEALEQGKIKYDDMVTVSSHAASMGGSQVFLEEGETQTVKDMIKCISIASANDASVAMAEFLGGSEEGFVQMMNDRAKELGMNDTNFVNACGLDVDGHVTSAYDIAVMSRELIKNHPEIKEYSTTWQDTIVHKTRKGENEFGLTNTNKLIKQYSKATGLKTGSTGKALYCLSATAENENIKLIAVIMAAPDPTTRFNEAVKLLDYGFANYGIEQAGKKGDIVAEVPIYKGSEKTVRGKTAEDVSILIKKGEDAKIETKTETIPNITAPINEGDKIGEIVYIADGKEQGRCDIVAENSVDKINISEMMMRLLSIWCR
ncbi:D-alanyl-D-alanine carboxypeptidase family protein [Tyzzerella sp. An114]|uniref:D-alanyl-D-alanine carboxypeptidase family protein n=1 Tax=Tyzzerella sp. An114 TaxID=1965545 RepID=UPI001FA8FA31|nr:D-alanyl-D-alanine carboxypeptidase family protein [Tyzzerella sp. An114]